MVKIIYEIKINGEKYIGSTTNLNNRLAQHKFNTLNSDAEHYNYKVYDYIRKNGGLDNCVVSILKILWEGASTIELKKEEQIFLDKLNPTLNTISAYVELTKKEYDAKRYKKKKLGVP